MLRIHRNYKDYLDFMLARSRYNGDNGRGDSVGRTVRAAIIYGGVFIQSIYLSFRGFLMGGPWNPQRHPEEPRTEDFSRDHTVWLVVWIKYFYPHLLHRALKIPWRISTKYTQTADMWLWIRAVARGWWIDKFLYWLIASPYLWFVARWNNKMYRKYGVYSVDYKDFVAYSYDKQSEMRWGILPDVVRKVREKIFPSYSFDIQAFMVKCLEDGWFKNGLKKRVIALVEPTNWLIRKLMDDTFTSEETKAMREYEGMDGWRPGRRLDVTIDVDLFPLSGEQQKYNMDVDALWADYELK